MIDNQEIKLKAKNTWLPAYSVSFDLKLKTYSDGKTTGVIPAAALERFVSTIGKIEFIPEPQLPTRKVKIDCTYDLLLFGRALSYTNYTFQVNPQLTDFQRALLKLADECGLKVY